jgi:hypothetical protein
MLVYTIRFVKCRLEICISLRRWGGKRACLTVMPCQAAISVGAASRIQNWGSNPGRWRFFSNPKAADPSWGPPSLLFSGYLDVFLQRQWGADVKLTTSLYPVLRLRTIGAMPPLPHISSLRALVQFHWLYPCYNVAKRHRINKEWRIRGFQSRSVR